MRLWNFRILNVEPRIKPFWESIFACVYFLRFSGETIESWRHRFFQNWRSPGLVIGTGVVTAYGRHFDLPRPIINMNQSESKCETSLTKMTVICMNMKLNAELIFVWKISHLDSVWNRGTRELGNGILLSIYSFLCWTQWNKYNDYLIFPSC